MLVAVHVVCHLAQACPINSEFHYSYLRIILYVIGSVSGERSAVSLGARSSRLVVIDHYAPADLSKAIRPKSLKTVLE